jgi:CheY-like chemotaxis protein
MAFNLLKKSQKETPVFTVLVICDDLISCTSIYNALNDSGYRVHTAVTAKEALRMLDDLGLPDVIIGDFLHPELDGKEFIEKARIRFGKSAMPPVLFLMDSREDAITAEQLGVHDLLPKPVADEKLVQCVSCLIETRTPAEK